MKIKCQACIDTPKSAGCGRCGGYKVLILRSETTCCKTKYWRRLDPFTVYEGKTFQTWDGLEINVTSLNPYTEVCSKCLKEIK